MAKKAVKKGKPTNKKPTKGKGTSEPAGSPAVAAAEEAEPKYPGQVVGRIAPLPTAAGETPPVSGTVDTKKPNGADQAEIPAFLRRPPATDEQKAAATARSDQRRKEGQKIVMPKREVKDGSAPAPKVSASAVFEFVVDPKSFVVKITARNDAIKDDKTKFDSLKACRRRCAQEVKKFARKMRFFGMMCKRIDETMINRDLSEADLIAWMKANNKTL